MKHITNNTLRGGPRLLAGLLILLALALPGYATSQEPAPDVSEIEGVGIEEHLGDQVPLDLAFNDEEGKAVKLGDYFDGKRPVILTLNYFKCPMLCGLMLTGLSDALSDLNWTPGKEFEIVTVSINPLEKPPLAKQNKQGYVKKTGRPEVAKGWHYLTGNEKEIKTLADTVGFMYKLDPKTQEFLHQAAIFVLMPDGRISRYLYGVQYPVNDVKLALSEAADGKIGTTTERIFLTCFTYDPESGSYVPYALGMMRIAGFATMIILAVVLGIFWARDASRRGREKPDKDSPTEGTT